MCKNLKNTLLKKSSGAGYKTKMHKPNVLLEIDLDKSSDIQNKEQNSNG